MQIAIITVASRVFFGTGWPRDLPELVLFVTAGVVCFVSLGVAFSHAIPNFDSAPAYVNAVFLPVILISIPFGAVIALQVGSLLSQLGAQSQTGLFTLWRKNGKVYVEMSKAQLGKDFIQSASPANGLGGWALVWGEAPGHDHLAALIKTVVLALTAD